MSFAAVLLVTLNGSCASEPVPAPLENNHPGVPVVVVLSIDGLRGDAIAAANAPTLQQLIREGASTLTAQTVLPSNTLPVHVSMFTGLTPVHHGIVWNDDTTTISQPVDATTVFDITSKAGLASAMFVGKSKLSNLVHPGAPTWLSIPQVGEIWLADRVTAQVLAYLLVAKRRPNVMFIHLPDVDLKGHEFGWMSLEYLSAVRHADNNLAKIWQGLRQAFGDDLILIVTADHGGLGHIHYDGTREATTIPWIAWGRRVVPQVLRGEVNLVDMAPTVLWLLGIAVPAGWDGVAATTPFTR